MKETRVYADGFQTTFANVEELMHFLKERAGSASWIRKPTKDLRLIPLKKMEMEEKFEETEQEILNDTKNHTELMLKMRGQTYPVRDCAIQTILKRAGISGPGLRKLDKPYYSKVVNYCLQVAKGEALIKIADGKVSAVHGGDYCDYSILEMQDVFKTVVEYLNRKYPGSSYVEGSGCYDHSVVTAMWELEDGEVMEVYKKALDAHSISMKVIKPALRLTTSDVAASGANLYPMLLCGSGNQTISLGNPIRLTHKGASIKKFEENLELLFSRYRETLMDFTKLMDIEIHHPVNCLMGILNKLDMKKKIKNEVVELFQSQNGDVACSAHDLYYALNEAVFFAACEGMKSQEIIRLEEEVAKVLSYDWA